MQGERSTFEPLCEAFEFDRPSGSSNPVMPQQMLWNDLPVSVDNPDIPSNPLSSSENISCANVSSQENASLNFWDLDGSSSSMPPLNQGSDDEMKLETGWVSSAVGNRVAGLRIVGGRPEVTSTLSFGNENTDLNNNSANNGENSSSEYLDFNALPHSTGYNTEHVGVSSRVHDSELHFGLHNPVLTRRIPISSPGSSLGGNSSKAIDFFSNNVRIRQEVAPCSSGKRKSIERVCGECSSGGNSIDLSDGVNHAEEEISMRISTIPAGEASDHHLFSGTAANGESFLRSTRMRISHADPTNSFTSDLWPQDNNVTRYNPWTTQPSPSSAALPSNQLVDFRVLDNNLGSRRQRHLRTIPVFSSDMYPFPQSGISTTEVGSSSGSPAVAVDGAELNSLAIPTTIPDQVFAPPDNTRNMVHDQTNWGSTSGSLVLPGNAVPASQVVANLGPYQSPGANWLTHQHRRRLSEAVRRSFFSAGSEARARSTSLPPRHNNSSTSQEVGRHHSGAASRLHQHPYMRLNMLHRQNYGALGISSTSRTLAAAREGRSRMTEQLHNVFELIRRGDNLLLEDVLLLEQSALVGGANIQDRYRDMRLDVDNMSYEELLALGERIGNVNTGLPEEKILDCLQLSKFASVGSESSEEVEPCCICREEYVEGEELGCLDCGHDFHTACIRKWLVIKNLCPICKTTALDT